LDLKEEQQKKRGKGRPSTNFDKKAYQREYMRKRRAAAKAKSKPTP